MNESLKYANVVTPKPGEKWVRRSADERLKLVEEAVAKDSLSSRGIIKPLSAGSNGNIVFQFTEPVGPECRGTILLDLEEYLKVAIDPGVYVSLEPLGDRNSLRNLRGIEVKS